MTYIIHEAVAGDDPRIDPKMETVGEFWHYSIIKFPSDQGIVYHWLNGVEVTESIAKAYKFTSAHENEVSVRVSTTNYDEISDGSGDTEDRESTKIYYRLTAEDQKNTIDFFKAIMKLHLQNRADSSSKNTQALASMIDRLSSVTDAQNLMYDYLDVGFAVNVTQRRAPKFNVSLKPME